LHPTRDSEVVSGTIGGRITALESAPDMVRVRSDGGTGWLWLPDLSKSRSEIVDFIGGLVRTFRGDWNGAESLFDEVIANPQTPNNFRTDALLYKGFAAVQQGRSYERSFAAASDLSPNAKRVVVYLVMGKLADYRNALSRAATDSTRKSLLARIHSLLANNRYLFVDSDPWLLQTTADLKRLEHGE
jgi:hypothetical protein